MAKLNFIYRGKRDTGKLSVRLTHGTQIDHRVSSSLSSFKDYWIKRTTKKDGTSGYKHLQRKQLTGDADLKKHKKKLKKIENAILIMFLNDYNKGVPITKDWLKNAINTTTAVLNTKDKIQDADQAAKAKANDKQKQQQEIIHANLLTTAVEKMFVKYQTNQDELNKYKVTLNLLLMYQKSKKQTFTIKDLNQEFANHFMNWALLDMIYAKSYINSQLKHLRASAVNSYENDEKEVIQISRTLTTFKMFDKIYKDKIVITLDYNELDKIDNTKAPKHLEDAKKAILLGCETGLRYSDLNKLVDTNIKSVNGVNYWKFRTAKTDVLVQIIISERILYLIKKYGLPTTNYPSNGVKLNRDLKAICKEAKLNEQIKGSKATVLKINDKKVIRNIKDYHKKHELISTRIFRRSFATNYYGKIDTALILAITGHSTEQQLKAYINIGDESNITRTKKQMDKYHKERKEAKNNVKLTVIPKASNQN